MTARVQVGGAISIPPRGKGEGAGRQRIGGERVAASQRCRFHQWRGPGSGSAAPFRFHRGQGCGRRRRSGSVTVRTAQFDTILNEPPVIIIQMRVNTCLPESVPRVIPHLETQITDTSFIQNNIKSDSPDMCSNIRPESAYAHTIYNRIHRQNPQRGVIQNQSLKLNITSST